MRQPTSEADLYRWWADAVAGKPVRRHEGEPHCGFYRRRFVARGPWVAVEIFCQRELNELGELTAPERLISRTPDGVERPAEQVWTYLEPISFREWKSLMTAICADPRFMETRAPVDLSHQPMRPA